LCKCHRKIDGDPKRYTSEELRVFKEEAEERARRLVHGESICQVMDSTQRTIGTFFRRNSLLNYLDLTDKVWHSVQSEANHELRAALICLLTAALAAKGTAAIIGQADGGWFWLPPWSLWEPWATQGLESAAKRMALKVKSVLHRPFPVGL
jgi:hypothetical protein